MDFFVLVSDAPGLPRHSPLPLPSWPGLSGPPVAAPAAIGGPDKLGHDEGGTVTKRRCLVLALSVCVPLLAGCMVGPDYKRPDAPTPMAFKELQGWKISQPADAVNKGDWWSVYHDPE